MLFSCVVMHLRILSLIFIGFLCLLLIFFDFHRFSYMFIDVHRCSSPKQQKYVVSLCFHAFEKKLPFRIRVVKQ